MPEPEQPKLDPEKFIDRDADHWRFVEPEPDPEALLLAALEIAEHAGDDGAAPASLDALARRALAELIELAGGEESAP